MTDPTPPSKIAGPKVPKRTDKDLASEVAGLLEIDPATISTRSAAVGDTLDQIYTAVTRQLTTGVDVQRKVAAILEVLGLTYDPRWDTGPGMTVTGRAYSRMLVALSERPRCFVLNTTDADIGTAWETDKEKEYRYDTTVSGRVSLNQAGPGSLVLFYHTSNHSQSPMSYTASARIDYIAPGPGGPKWVADLSGFRWFDEAVPAARVDIVDRNPQNAITEITWEQYQEIVTEGTGSRPEPQDQDVEAGSDVGGEQAAARVKDDYPPADVDVAGDHVPDRREDGFLIPSLEREPAYLGEHAKSGTVYVPPRRRTADDRARDKIVEERAVILAIRHLTSLGWELSADRQKDGVGYDVELTHGSRTMHLEIKGIQGTRLEFNLTAKEWRRALTDPDFVLAGVTDVLNPTKVHVHLLGPEELAAADRAATQFRVSVKGHSTMRVEA